MAVGATSYDSLKNNKVLQLSLDASELLDFSFDSVSAQDCKVLVPSGLESLNAVEYQAESAYLLKIQDHEIGALVGRFEQVGFGSAFPSICHGESWGLAHWDVESLASALNVPVGDWETSVAKSENLNVRFLRQVVPLLVDPRLHIRIYKTLEPNVHALTCHIDLPGFRHFNLLAHLNHRVELLQQEACEVIDALLSRLQQGV